MFPIEVEWASASANLRMIDLQERWGSLGGPVKQGSRTRRGSERGLGNSQIREEHSMDQCQSRLKLSENFDQEDVNGEKLTVKNGGFLVPIFHGLVPIFFSRFTPIFHGL